MTEYKFNRLIDFANYLEELAQQREIQAMRAAPKQSEFLAREKYILRNVAMMVRRLEIKEIVALYDTIEGIKAALNTEQTGTNLIEVARDAHDAELKLAAHVKSAKVVPFKKK